MSEYNWGIVYNSVTDVHAKPKHSSERVSQVLLGMPVKVVTKQDDWIKVQTAEEYTGWISGAVKMMTESAFNSYMAQSKVLVTSMYAQSFSKPHKQSLVVSDIVMGNVLYMKEKQGTFYHVIYPDGREAYLDENDVQPFDNWLNNIELTGESIVETANKMMGISYVWGGTSAHGLDCSGFTKLVYWLHGLIIPRDASQQVQCGIEVDRAGAFNKLQKGDLVFFGTKANSETSKERVVHVGIYIGNWAFIHASDYVHVSSFDPKSRLFDQFNTNRYLRTMRYMGKKSSTRITQIKAHPFYSKAFIE